MLQHPGRNANIHTKPESGCLKIVTFFEGLRINGVFVVNCKGLIFTA
jgi:hypothetical protein